MRNLIKNELLHMYSSKEFRIALGLAMFIAIWQGVYVDIYGETIGYAIEGEIEYGGLFECWLGAGVSFAQSYWYYLVMPLIATLAYAGSVFDDKKSGYIKQVCIRSSRRQYYLAKAIAVFIAGGFSCVFPFVINFMIIAMKYPVLYPSLYRGFGPDSSEVGGVFFWIHPIVYTVLFLLFDFALCGIFALVSMLLCMKLHYKYIAVVFPFAISFFLYELGVAVDTTDIAPKCYMVPQYGIENVWTLVGIAILGVIVFATILLMGKRNEI